MDPAEAPRLILLHNAASLNAVKLAVFRRISTSELTASLIPGQPGALKARPDGTLLDGHHRVTILIERGVNINLLPRDIIERES